MGNILTCQWPLPTGSWPVEEFPCCLCGNLRDTWHSVAALSFCTRHWSDSDLQRHDLSRPRQAAFPRQQSEAQSLARFVPRLVTRQLRRYVRFYRVWRVVRRPRHGCTSFPSWLCASLEGGLIPIANMEKSVTSLNTALVVRGCHSRSARSHHQVFPRWVVPQGRKFLCVEDGT